MKRLGNMERLPDLPDVCTTPWQAITLTVSSTESWLKQQSSRLMCKSPRSRFGQWKQTWEVSLFKEERLLKRTFMWSRVILADCGASWQRAREKCPPRSLMHPSVPSLLLCSAVLVFNADRMCQQIQPNKTHLSRLASLRLPLCQHGDALSSRLVSTGRRRGRCRAARQNDWSAYPSVHLTLEVTGKSDKVSLRLSDSDILIGSPGLVVLCASHEVGSSYEFLLCVSALICTCDEYYDWKRVVGQCHVFTSLTTLSP